MGSEIHDRLTECRQIIALPCGILMRVLAAGEGIGAIEARKSKTFRFRDLSGWCRMYIASMQGIQEERFDWQIMT